MHRHKYLTIRKQELDPTLSVDLSWSSYPGIIPYLLLLSWVCLTTQMILHTHTLSLNINPKVYCIPKHRAGSSLNISSSTSINYYSWYPTIKSSFLSSPVNNTHHRILSPILHPNMPLILHFPSSHQFILIPKLISYTLYTNPHNTYIRAIIPHSSSQLFLCFLCKCRI
jgi:hypothetical protein